MVTAADRDAELAQVVVDRMCVAADFFPDVQRIKYHEAGQDQECCEREVDEVEWRGDRVYLRLGGRLDESPRR
jgi:hypothetical protein